MNFDEFKEQSKPTNIKPADLVAGKIKFCLVGNAEFIEGNYQGKPTFQHRADIVHLINDTTVTDSVFLPGGKFWQNFFSGLEKHPEFRHNLYLIRDGQAYDIKQASGVCPCQAHKKQSNGFVSRETPDEATEDIDSILSEYGFEEAQEPPITNKQKQDIALLCKALRIEVPNLTDWTEQLGKDFIADLKEKHAGLKAKK